jgi:hypothetical protein
MDNDIKDIICSIVSFIAIWAAIIIMLGADLLVVI